MHLALSCWRKWNPSIERDPPTLEFGRHTRHLASKKLPQQPLAGVRTVPAGLLICFDLGQAGCARRDHMPLPEGINYRVAGEISRPI